MHAIRCLAAAACVALSADAAAGDYWHAPGGGGSGYAAPASAPPAYYPPPVSAPAAGYGRGRCGDGRPCGPAVINLVAPQSFFGADFRPACAAHDACYGASGASRYECDARFRQQMHAACADSRFPAGCHACAESRYFAVKTFGGPFFVGSQYGFPGGW